MASFASLSFFISLTLATSLPPHAFGTPTESGDAFIQDICSKTSDPNTCLSALESDPASKTADLKGLDMISIKVASAKASSIANTINELLKTSEDPFLLQAYDDCSEYYLDAVDQLDDSILALDSKGYNDVETWVNTAITDADACNDSFSDHQSHKFSDNFTDHPSHKFSGPSPVAAEEEEFKKLCGVIVDITKMLEG